MDPETIADMPETESQSSPSSPSWPAADLVASALAGIASPDPAQCCHILHQLHLLSHRLQGRPGLRGAVRIIIGNWRGSLPANHTAQLAKSLNVSTRAAAAYLAAIRRHPILSRAVIWTRANHRTTICN